MSFFLYSGFELQKRPEQNWLPGSLKRAQGMKSILQILPLPEAVLRHILSFFSYSTLSFQNEPMLLTLISLYG